ncbi:MAG TPA: hypothetical protein PLN95_02645 [Candidatus Saccharibacteria bacterium]|nr:hypothetical protein [Candidatus Saccharibacteria bacterium]
MSIYRSSPYVGVSGIVNPEQQQELTAFAAEAFRETDTLLMLGVKAVHKTQWLDVENKYGPEWYPIGESAFSGALSGSGVDSVAQMYLDPEVLAANPDYGRQFIRRIKRRGAAWLNTIQFDMLRYQDAPEAFSYLIHEAKREDVRDDEYNVIVQCHAPAMAEGPRVALEKLKRLSPDEINWILFDASHGTGKEMDVDALKRFIEAAHDDSELDHVGIGIAGGLDAEGVEKHLPKILRDFPYVSWDAEGRLHQTSDGSLDMEATKRYISASADVILSQP